MPSQRKCNQQEIIKSQKLKKEKQLVIKIIFEAFYRKNKKQQQCKIFSAFNEFEVLDFNLICVTFCAF